MGVKTVYVCDKCRIEEKDNRKIASFNFNSVFGTPVVNKVLCRQCWRDFIHNIILKYFSE